MVYQGKIDPRSSGPVRDSINPSCMRNLISFRDYPIENTPLFKIDSFNMFFLFSFSLIRKFNKIFYGIPVPSK